MAVLAVLVAALLACSVFAHPVSMKLASNAVNNKVNGNWDPMAIAETFINLGEQSHDPTTSNCTRYADLFLTDAVLHSPGIPDASGRQDIINACQVSHSLVNPLISFQSLNIPVMSWNTEKRLAFSWTLNGVRTRDGEDVNAPVISALFCDTNGKIEDAWSFYDDNLIKSGVETAPPFNASQIVLTYTNLGGDGSSSDIHNCTAWAALYAANGINNEPGLPPSQGWDSLEALCTRRIHRWKVFLPSTQITIPVMSWNTEKRLAFQWTISGYAQDGKSYVVPAITVLFMDSNGIVSNAWDWWDDSILPPPPPASL